MKILASPLVVSVLLGAAGFARGEDEDQVNRIRSRQTTSSSRSSFTMAVFGDWPYSQALLDDHMRLVDSVNGYDEVDVVAHLGDIHSGSMPCTGAGYNGPATITSTSNVPAGLTLPVGTCDRIVGGSFVGLLSCLTQRCPPSRLHCFTCSQPAF